MKLTVCGVERGYRFAAPTVALVAFFAFWLLYLYGDRALYFMLLEYWGVEPFRFPFLDISGSLAAWECARQGLDVIVSDPCDVLQRSYSYSPIWMSWSVVPLGLADTPAVGWVSSLLFLSSLAVLPRPRRPFELALTLLATLSTAVVFAVERANPDILLFMLALVTALSAEGGLAVRMVGYAVAVVSGLIKYYPLVSLVLLAEERVPIFLAVSSGIVLILAWFGVTYHEEIVRTLPYIPRGTYIEGVFGAKNVSMQLAEVAKAMFGQSEAIGMVVAAICFALLAGVVVAIGRRFIVEGLPAAMAALPRREHNLLVIGSALICGCFFAGQNVWYRAIYLLLVLPGLLAIGRGAENDHVRNWSIWTSIAVVFLMWEEAFRFGMERAMKAVDATATQIAEAHFLFWLFREVVWWWAVAILAAILFQFLRQSAVARAAQSWLLQSDRGHRAPNRQITARRCRRGMKAHRNPATDRGISQDRTPS
jgi:hypothetical protein